LQVRLKDWSLATIKGVSYGVRVVNAYPRKYSLKCNAWTEVPDADAVLLETQYPGRLVISKTADPIKSQKVAFANVPRAKGKDPQDPKSFTRVSKNKATGPTTDPEVPDGDPEIEADGGTADGPPTG